MTLIVSSNLDGRGKAKSGGACAVSGPSNAPAIALLAIFGIVAGYSLRRRKV
jgi:MYXO-CTERM domain-containing protein